MSEARGFAVAELGCVQIDTVSATARDAMVNWLHPRRAMIDRSMSETHIRRVFSQCAERSRAELVRVTILPERVAARRASGAQPEVEEGEY